MVEESSKQDTPKRNGFAVRSWGDVLAVAGLLSLLLGFIAWGLKLEGELNTVRNQLAEVRAEVGKGVLPRAEERIDSHEQRIDKLELDQHKDHGD